MNCDTLFLNPLPSQKNTDQIYRSFTYDNGAPNEQQIRTRAHTILKKLKKLNPTGKSLLDIGSGYGYFLDEALKRGFEITGIEPSKKLYVQSINQMHIKQIFNFSFDKFYLANKSKKFDFITLIHVMEHVPNPQKTIVQALKLLNPNGVLFIETPNLTSHLFNVEKDHYTFLTPPDHIWIFSIKSFETMLQSHLVSINQLIDTYSLPEHFMGIIKKKFLISNFQFLFNYKINNNVNKKKYLIKNSDLKIDLKLKISNLKFRLLDRLIAPLFTPILNLGGYGSILELYIKKK